MTRRLKDDYSSGFAMLELLAVLVVIVIIVAVGYFVWNKQHDKTTRPVAVQTVAPLSSPVGTTGNVNQGIVQGEQGEDSAYDSYSTSVQQNTTSDSGSLNNLAGAYNENNL